MDKLTNEDIVKKFNSHFELVNYAIKLSGQMIESQRAPMVKTDNQNTAVIIIQEISEGKDKLLDVLPISREIIAEPQMTSKSNSHAPASKPTEKKKTRRILV